MIPNGSVEQSLLHVRISELERRLERLEERLADIRPAAAREAAEPSPPEASSGGHPTAEPVLEVDEAEEGMEGARLVAIELLSSGYTCEEVASYLRSTFGIADVGTVLGSAGLVPG